MTTIPSEYGQVVHVQGQIGDRRQHSGGSGGQQVPAVRVLCAQLGQKERGEPGDRIGPSFQNSTNGTSWDKNIIGLHLYTSDVFESRRRCRSAEDRVGILGSERHELARRSKLQANPEANQLASSNLRKHSQM